MTTQPKPEIEIGDRVEWCGYNIKRKQDFSKHERDRGVVGYVVSRGMVNVMPGATWFGTVASAKQGIAALELAKRIAPTPDGDGCDSHIFWMLMELTRKGD